MRKSKKTAKESSKVQKKGKKGKSEGKVTKKPIKRRKSIMKLKKRKPKTIKDKRINDFIDFKDILNENYPTNINKIFGNKIKKIGFGEDNDWSPPEDLVKQYPIFGYERQKLKHASDCSIAYAYKYAKGLQQKLEKLKKMKSESGGLVKREDIDQLFDITKKDEKESFKTYKNKDFELKIKV